MGLGPCSQPQDHIILRSSFPAGWELESADPTFSQFQDVEQEVSPWDYIFDLNVLVNGNLK